ncbi:hypothetical protein Gohar_006942 [Gossypium harknessii]|uniref:Uncharacterized protein n=1 Tax=Gossypium harknessii TaxID=34285 RepID=A0A7J9GFN8_9ROSI|nr:hypothetical protein [Gossypium harknessii]
MHGKKKKENNEQSESLAPLLLLTYRETGEQNEELEASTMERTNSKRTNSRGFPNLTVSASTAPKGRRGRKRKMKTVVSSEAEASIRV